MKWIIVIFILLLNGCSSSAPNKVYYQLPVRGGIQQESNTSISHKLWLQDIELADFLSQGGLVYQTNDVQYIIANSHLWASPLEQQLDHTLLENLTSSLPGWLISTQSAESEQDILKVTVTGFHARYDGNVIVRGYWLLTHKDKLLKREFDLILPQEQDGYDGVVRALATAWQREAQEMAAQVARYQ